MDGSLACSGAFCAFATEAAGFSQLFPGLTSRLLTLSGQFGYYNLGYREIMLATGACAATKQGMETLFKQASFEESYVKKYKNETNSILHSIGWFKEASILQIGTGNW